MTCEPCGDTPKKKKPDFTKAVIEIDNPETLVLLRKVVIPASMGDETDVPPAVGKYRNVILQYEVSKNTYLYSSDGIPAKIEVSQEVVDRIEALEEDVAELDRDLAAEIESRQLADGVLQQQIDDIKNNPDVVDIVDTYADLVAYDTSGLTDKDIIRVLEDETHDGQSTYYRWGADTGSWTYVGAAGDYYTREQVDTLLDAKQDELTAGENVSIEDESGALVISAVDTTYTAGTGLNLSGTEFSVDTSTVATQSDLAAEATARESADATLQNNIDAEETARIDADIALSTVIGNEVTVRQNADTALGTRIDGVVGDLSAEITARQSADTTLQTNITNEATARANADTTLQTNIDAEATTRANADTALNTAIGSEATARQGADTNLQSQIDAIVASSDVKDIVGTYAELQAYPTSTLGNNDIIKVLDDENQNDQTTYYRWSTTTSTFTLIGAEGPFYTKSQTDTLLNGKQNTLTAGSNIQIVGSTISATDTTYTAGSGLSLSGTQFSVDTSTIATQSDLTSGLATKQDTITSSNKLSADLVDDTNTTNKFVTTANKATWDAKQDALTAGTNITIANNVISAEVPATFTTNEWNALWS